MASFKRNSEAFPHGGERNAKGKTLGGRFDALSKADWADAYADLYRQVFGETAEAEAEAIMQDAERRTELAKLARKVDKAAHPVIGYTVVVAGSEAGQVVYKSYAEDARNSHDAINSACERAKAAGVNVFSASATPVRQ